MVIDGKRIADEILTRLKSQPKPKKFLAAVLVGENEASVSFLKQKEKAAKELGLDFRLYKFPGDIKQDALRDEVLKIAQHSTCGGVIVQLPLPEQLNPVRGREGTQRASASNGMNRHYILNVIPREKDVDILGERALGAFYTGRNPVSPPVVGVVEEVLKAAGFSLAGKNAAVVGAGFLVGQPIATWLKGKVKELYVLDKGSDFGVLKNADLVISGVGKAGLIKSEMLKSGALVIDFGYDNGKGDFDLQPLTTSDKPLVSYTPTPGGTGPILVAKLLENFYKLNTPT